MAPLSVDYFDLQWLLGVHAKNKSYHLITLEDSFYVFHLIAIPACVLEVSPTKKTSTLQKTGTEGIDQEKAVIKT